MANTGIYGEHGLDVYDDAAFQNPKVRHAREGNFMEKPDDGWLHDDRALGAGRGIFYKYDVKWVGSCVLGASVREFDIKQQTLLLRSIIAHVDDPETFPSNVKIGGNRSYQLGEVTAANINCMLSISANGLMVAPPGFEGGEDDKIGIINFIPMRLVSLVAGGQDDFYNYICYVGKDPNSKIREAFVFDCGDAVDEILQTIGQAFVLFQQESARLKAAKVTKPSQEYIAVTDEGVVATNEAFAMPLGHEAIYDTAAKNSSENNVEALYDIGSNPMVADVVTNNEGEVDTIAEELMNLMKSEAKCTYDTSENLQGAIDPSKLLQTFAEEDNSKNGGWVHFQPPKDMTYASLEEIQEMQRQEALRNDE